MATAMNSSSKRRYSWWWDSHISPKNSKWLQQNLTDMDSKVKAMIRLIEEDADSFARRAEMYYKKRPELMKLVEEFYRAYRALAESYNHATGELRQAHKTIAAAFPNEYVLADDSLSGTSDTESEPRTPELIPHQLRAWLDADDPLGLSSTNFHTLKRNGVNSEESGSGISKRGMKQLNEMFGSRGGTMKKAENSAGPSDLNTESDLQYLKKALVEIQAEKEAVFNQHQQSLQKLSNVERELSQAKTDVPSDLNTESDLQYLKKALVEIQAEKEAVFNQHQQSLQKLSNVERELSQAKTDVGGLDERAKKAEIEIDVLKEALSKLEDEKNGHLLNYNNCLEQISSLEVTISRAHEDAKRVEERAEIEAENLKKELSRMEEEKETGLNQYTQCLEIISALENKITLAEENTRLLNEQTGRAESEVEILKQAVSKLTEEKEEAGRRYEHCLEVISKMESEISRAQEDSKHLNSEILVGNEKLKSVEEQCIQLERFNEFLHIDAENLAREIAAKDQRLSDKQNELEKLQNSLQDEHSRFLEVETTLYTLQKLHSLTQEKQRALTLELQEKFQMLTNLEVRNNELEKGNLSLHELNTSSDISKQNLENEILTLKEMKEKLEEHVSIQVAQSNVLQQEVFRLKEEIKGMNMRYQALLEKVQSVGLNPECLESSVKELQDENSKLKEACKTHCTERETLFEKLRDMENLIGKTAALEKSLSELNGKLEESRERIKDLQDASQYHHGEKSALVTEKATLLSQLTIMTQNMQILLEKKSLLENSLKGANVELEGLRAKSRSLEEFCQLLKNEKSNIIEERNLLISRLQSVEQRLGNLELRFTKLEEKYADLEKEKDSTLVQVEELRACLSVEQQERASYEKSSQSRMADLENQLQEENRSRKKEFDEELEKAVGAQVEIFILQKFIKDLEEKNLSLLIECQKHVEASKLSDKLIVELESENNEQQMEGEFLLDEIEKLRLGIYQVFRALHFDPVNGQVNKIRQDEVPLPHIIDSIKDLKRSFLSNMDEKHQVTIENSVLLTILREFGVGAELELEKNILDREFKIMAEQCKTLVEDKHDLLEKNGILVSEVRKGEQREEALKAELENQNVKMASAYIALQEENSKGLEENRSLLEKLCILAEEKHLLEEENIGLIQETCTLSTLLAVFKSFGTEKADQVRSLAEELNGLYNITNELKIKIDTLGEKLENKEAENRHLSEVVEKLSGELCETRDVNDQLAREIVTEKDSIDQKANELLEAEQKLTATHILNAELSRIIKELNGECRESKQTREGIEKQIIELSENNKLEIESLHQANEKLESQMIELHEKMEEQMIREENLCSELQERENEFGLWEAEAASFYFDFQASTIREIFLENKVQELTTICQTLESDCAAKNEAIEEMKKKVGVLESKISQFSTYAPVIVSLKESITSLEHNAVLRTQLRLPCAVKQMGDGLAAGQLHETSYQDHIEVSNVMSDLLEMTTRIKAVEKAVLSEEAEERKLRSTSCRGNEIQEEVQEGNRTADNLKLQKTKPRISEPRNGMMKDIQVSDAPFYGKNRKKSGEADDQMLGLWESAEQDYRKVDKQAAPPMQNAILQRSQNPSSELQDLSIDKLEISTSIREQSEERKKLLVLQRLHSDSHKLTSLQTSVADMKKKAETNKRSKKKPNDVEYKKVEQQLDELEDAVLQLIDINERLTKDANPSTPVGKTPEETGNDKVNRVLEQAWKGSEKIGRLQFEMQNIQYILVKLEDENKTKSKFPGGILLRDFVYNNNGRRSTRRRKKFRFCGCVRSSANSDSG